MKLLQLNEPTHMAFTMERFFEIAVESLPQWDLNPQSPNSFWTFCLTELQGLSSTRTQSYFLTATPISLFVIVSATRRKRGIKISLCLSVSLWKYLKQQVKTLDARTSTIFLFLAGNTLFGKIWSKNKKISKLSV